MEEEGEVDLAEPDYYATLNVPRDASQAQIKTAYKDLVLWNHPDKQRDPALTEIADAAFSKIKRAYEVLGDPQKRQLYDMHGEEGLDAADDLAMVPFTNHPERIRAEYELRERERAFERAKAMADPTGRMDCEIDARALFASEDDYNVPSVGVSSMTLRQGISLIPSQHDQLRVGQ